MAGPFDKLEQSLKEAIAYVQGDCEHDWDEWGNLKGAQVHQCRKCGVRITMFPTKLEQTQ